MRKIFTFGGLPVTRNHSVAEFVAGKGRRKFVQTTAVDRVEAAAGADAVYAIRSLRVVAMLTDEGLAVHR